MPGPRSGWGLSLALLAAQGFAAAGGALATLVLAGLMTPEAFGRGNALIGIAMLGSLAISINMEAGAIRFLCTGAPGDRARFLRGSDRVILAGGALATLPCAGAIVLGWAEPLEAAAIAALLPALALFRARARQGTALGAPGRAAVPRLVARPAVFLSFAAAVWALNLRPEAWTLPGALLLAALGGLAIQWRLLLPLLRPLRRCDGAGGSSRAWLGSGVGFLPALLLTEFHRPLALVAAGLALPAATLGQLALALSLAALPGLAIVAVEMATTPLLTRAALAGDPAGTGPALARIARGRCLALLAGLVPFAFLLDPVAERLFPQYPGLACAAWPLLLIPVGRTVFGNPLQVLALRGENRGAFRLCATWTLLTLVAIPAGGALGGAPGAALAAALTQAGAGVALWAMCRDRCGIDLSLLSLRRAAPASLGAA